MRDADRNRKVSFWGTFLGNVVAQKVQILLTRCGIPGKNFQQITERMRDPCQFVKREPAVRQQALQNPALVVVFFQPDGEIHHLLLYGCDDELMRVHGDKFLPSGTQLYGTSAPLPHLIYQHLSRSEAYTA
jgi:hypothetical protein